MEWGRAKQAGFLLAALLADDQALTLAGPSLAAETRAALEKTVPAGLTREAKAQIIADWLQLLRPELDASALQLPARLRGVLARSARPPLKAQLLADCPSVRGGFTLESGLAGAALRIARHAARRGAR